MAVDSSLEAYDRDQAEQSFQYRALSTGAVASVVFAVVSVMIFPAALTSLQASLIVSPLPLAGLLIGVAAFRRIARTPEELTGKPLAAIGAFACLALLVGGLATASYVYATEVPEGYARITFTEMRPNEREEALGIGVPPDVTELDGRQVFIKGYIRPSSQQYQLDSFLLVRDNNQCCFGDLSQVKYYDQIQVRLVPPLRADYSSKIFRVAGILKVDESAANQLALKPTFTLVADYIQ